MDNKETLLELEADDFADDLEDDKGIDDLEFVSLMNGRVREILDEIDYCYFNLEALPAIAGNIRTKKTRFLNKTESGSPEDLSIANPRYFDKLKYGLNEVSWWKFLGGILRDAFPEFSFKKFGINRVDMFSVIITHLVIPIMKLEKGDPIEIDTDLLEKAFNEKLLVRIVQKRQAND